MKKLIYSTLILIVTILSSCVTKDISIVKRKYSPGYYVNVNHSKKANALKIEDQNLNDFGKNNLTKLSTSNKEVDVLNATVSQTLLAESKAHHIQTNYLASKLKNSAVLSALNKQNLMGKNTYKEQYGKEHNKNLVDKSNIKDSKISKLLKAKGNKSETDLIILVILSLFPFIALIAMYLKDGNEITLNFWVDLLLHFTIIGYAIFAILVVLDIVNLA